MSRLTTLKLLLVVLASTLLAGVGLGLSSTAQAQVSCADQPFGWEVSTAAEFNEAVDCHNQIGSNTSNIVLLNDITSNTVAGAAVFEPISNGDMIIIGQGFTLRRGSAAPTDAVPVLLFNTPEATSNVGPIRLGIEVGPHDTAGIEHQGPSALRIITTSIRPAAEGSTATGVISINPLFNGDLTLIASSIEGVPTGVQAERAGFSVEASTIASTGVDISAGGDSLGRVVNSTLGGPIGIRLDGGGADVDNSTVLGDGAAVSAAAGDFDYVSFRSSIVNTCSADETNPAPDEPGPGWYSRGFNVGGCFGADTELLELADNGCNRQTPVGCPRTAAIGDVSLARDAGLCLPGEPYEGDQRGFPRQPQGPGCDAGAFESGCTIDARDVVVATGVEFSQALVCHNFGNAATAITLIDDIVAQTVSDAAVFPLVTRGDLTIFGGQHSLSRAASAGDRPLPLLALALGERGSFEALQLGFEVGPADTVGLQHSGANEITLRGVAAYPGPDGSSATGIRSAGQTSSSFFQLKSSTVVGLPLGVEVAGLVVVISDSTIESTGTDLDTYANSLAVVRSSTFAGPTGIRFGPGVVHVENSTILGNGAFASPEANEEAFVTFVSSIVNSCTATEILTDLQPGPGWVDLENNVGGCLDASQPLDLVLADNGCRFVNPLGCARTAAIDTESPARSAGECGGGRVEPHLEDQRGEPRTPVGPGCDTGAFERAEVCIADGGASFFDARSADDLNRAIQCLNESAPAEGRVVVVDIRNDIEAPSLAGTAVFEQLTADSGVLILRGNGNTLRRGVSAGTVAAPVLEVATQEFVQLILEDIVIDVGASDTHGLLLNHQNQFELRRSVISSTAPQSTATGIAMRSAQGANDLGGDNTIEASIIDGMLVGVQAVGGGDFGEPKVDVNRSTITSSAIDLDVRGEALVEVTASTLGAPIGVRTQDLSFAMVQFSTVLGDGAAITPQSIGGVSFLSSMVATCSAPLGGAVLPASQDDGGNVGGCFSPGQVIDTTLADNGCEAATPAGCPLTVALGAGSVARQAGDCTDVGGTASLTDQRGESRTPVGPGCDAGSFEAAEPLSGDVTDNGVVDNADVQALLVWLAGGIEPPNLSAGDVTGDDLTKLDDALALAQLIANDG